MRVHALKTPEELKREAEEEEKKTKKQKSEEDEKKWEEEMKIGTTTAREATQCVLQWLAEEPVEVTGIVGLFQNMKPCRLFPRTPLTDKILLGVVATVLGTESGASKVQALKRDAMYSEVEVPELRTRKNQPASTDEQLFDLLTAVIIHEIRRLKSWDYKFSEAFGNPQADLDDDLIIEISTRLLTEMRKDVPLLLHTYRLISLLKLSRAECQQVANMMAVARPAVAFLHDIIRPQQREGHPIEVIVFRLLVLAIEDYCGELFRPGNRKLRLGEDKPLDKVIDRILSSETLNRHIHFMLQVLISPSFMSSEEDEEETSAAEEMASSPGPSNQPSTSGLNDEPMGEEEGMPGPSQAHEEPAEPDSSSDAGQAQALFTQLQVNPQNLSKRESTSDLNDFFEGTPGKKPKIDRE